MATTKQKQAARENLKKARAARSARAKGKKGSNSSNGLSTADKKKLKKKDFAFPDQRKEPLTDAGHVRNAIARFDQVEDVTDSDRKRAWKRIRKAAKRYDVEVSESSWKELVNGSKAGKKNSRTKASSKKTGSKKAGSKK